MSSHKFVFGGEKKVRADKFLAEQDEIDLSRSFLRKLFDDGCVKVGGDNVKANYLLKSGEEVVLDVPEVKEANIQPEDIKLDVIYEDGDVIVVNKEAGMVVHPTDSGHNMTGTLVNALMFHCKDLSGIGGVLRPGIVHRLDKGTSGVLIVAKNDKAHRYLSDQIKERKVKKVYKALVKGRLQPENGSIDAPIGRSLYDRKKMAVTEQGNARDALTHYKVLQYLTTDFDGGQKATYSLVEVEIVTGRTHQIRVHFQSIGFPIVGDEVYGDAKTNSLFRRYGLKRPFLHACKLGVVLPSSSDISEFEAGLPDDLAKVLAIFEE